MPQADDGGLLIDARDYYRAFYLAAREARRYILIAGWRFNSDVRLLRGPDADEPGEEVEFLPFLSRLCQEKPELHVYVLAWDFSLIFAREWELFQEWKFQQAPPERLVFRFDDQHAVGASHHQKFVVIDGQIGFVGGLDFNADDWDDRRHLAHNPLRADSGRPPHKPYHDIQACVAGPAAAELADYFGRRWERSGGGKLEMPPLPSAQPPTVEPTIRLPPNPVALSLTQPGMPSQGADHRQIRQLYLDAIAAADELIYIENQYFSSQAVCQALIDRMRAADRPTIEIVLVLPKQCNSWVEAVTVGLPRIPILDALWETARETGHQLGVYYTTALRDDGQEVLVVLHSKLMIVDDRLLTVGSCNTSNRSMGLDTELNATWEADANGNDLVRSIRRARVSLLAEHCGLPEETPELQRPHGLVEYLDGLADARTGRLRRLTREAIFDDQEWLKHVERMGLSFDPGAPLMDEEDYESMRPSSDSLLDRGLRWFKAQFSDR
jgi:phosphatidylserine/phosphatidylglycerophosphate/cardiolipin synthase-like enzyme